MGTCGMPFPPLTVGARTWLMKEASMLSWWYNVSTGHTDTQSPNTITAQVKDKRTHPGMPGKIKADSKGSRTVLTTIFSSS